MRGQRDHSVLYEMLASEAIRHLEYARSLAREAREVLGKDLQAFEKIFALWEKLFAVAVTIVLIRSLTVRGGWENFVEKLRKYRDIEEKDDENEVVIMMVNIPIEIENKKENIIEIDPELEKIIERLNNVIDNKIYNLHYAFYEGSPEHAGFDSEEQALEYARRVLEELEDILARLETLIRH